MRYKKFDLACKISFVEDYLERIKTNKISMSEYAKNKGIAETTFSDWVLRYKRDRSSFVNGKNTTEVIDMNTGTLPTFIEITEEKIVERKNNDCPKTIKLNYKDVSLEFGVDNLEMVLEMIRRW